MSAFIVYRAGKSVDWPGMHKVSAMAPWQWLRHGGVDFVRHWPISLALGAVFAGLGYGLVHYAWAHLHLAMALSTGFLLVAPFLAVGFYDLSRRDEYRRRGENIAPLAGLRRNAGSVGLFALLLAFLLSAWERLSALIVGMFFSGGVTLTGEFSLWALWSAEHMGFMLAYFGFGAALAALTFALSVVTVPMLIDREVDMVTAMLTSLRTVRENPGPMLIWAAIIAILTAVGMAAAFVGLVFLFPLLGHASWHAYRGLVAQ